MGFVSNRSEVSQSYHRKFARRIVNMRRNRHGVEVAKATQSELITFEELLRKFTLYNVHRGTSACNFMHSQTSLF
jgi:hypothetical protein